MLCFETYLQTYTQKKTDYVFVCGNHIKLLLLNDIEKKNITVILVLVLLPIHLLILQVEFNF